MKRKKRLGIGIIIAGTTVLAAYFGIPPMAEYIITQKLTANPAHSVDAISIRWAGPQTVTGFHFEDGFGTADVDVEIENGLFSLVATKKPIRVFVKGDVVLAFEQDASPSQEVSPSTHQTATSETISTLPSLALDMELTSVTIDGEEPIVFTDVLGTFDISAGHHFAGELVATTDLSGSIEVNVNVPNFIDDTGAVNWYSEGSLKFAIHNMPIPTISGVGGWSIIAMTGELSSANFAESANLSIDGSLAEYDTPRGSILIKSQLANPVQEGEFVFDERELVGSIELVDVPTSILAPFLNIIDIDTVKDLGPTMNLRVQRSRSGSPFVFHLETEHLKASGIIDPDGRFITEVDIVASVRSELLQSLTQGEVSGNTKLSLHIDRFGPTDRGEAVLVGNMQTEGQLTLTASGNTVDRLHAAFEADVQQRFIAIVGSARIDNQSTTFEARLQSNHKNKLDGLDDLWKIIARQLPRGSGRVVVNNLPTSSLQPYFNQEPFDLVRDIGAAIRIEANFVQNHIELDASSNNMQISGTAHLKGKEITHFTDVDFSGTVNAQLATKLTGVQFGSETTVKTKLKNVDFKGNANFDVSLDIGTQHTTLQGTSIRIAEGDAAGNLNVKVIAKGIDTRLLDVIFDFKGFLVDSIGSPLVVELDMLNILDAPVLYATGSSPQTKFQSALLIGDGTVSTVLESATVIDIELSPELKRRLLKEPDAVLFSGLGSFAFLERVKIFGPVLSDIRSVKHPIHVSIQHATASLEGDLSRLNADIFIDIGEVALDSGSASMQLLPIFNTKHVESVPAFFDPIHIEIRNGIATYKKFHLTLANKYSIPYSGTINLINRNLHLKSAVPLTGLGYSIKEFRGLTKDIDVPILITGTIDNPIVRVDPHFDLGKILQSAAVGALGDALEDALSGGDKKAPNPLQLLEELLNK